MRLVKMEISAILDASSIVARLIMLLLLTKYKVFNRYMEYYIIGHILIKAVKGIASLV